jgi:hypothetical protein
VTGVTVSTPLITPVGPMKWQGGKLTAMTPGTQRRLLDFIQEFLCVLCVSAVKTV